MFVLTIVPLHQEGDVHAIPYVLHNNFNRG